MSLNKTKLRGYLRRMIGGLYSGMPNPSEHWAMKVFGGTDMRIEIRAPGQPAIIAASPVSATPIPTIVLVDDGVEAMNEYIDECQQDSVIGESVGEKAVEQQVAMLLRQLAGATPTNDDIDKAIRTSLQTLRSLVATWTVYVAVDNLVLKDMGELRFGHVRLMPTVLMRPDMKARLFGTYDRTSNAAPNKQRMKVSADDLVSNHYPANGTTAEVVVNAEESRLADAAVSTCEESLNVLRGFTHLLFPESHGCCFALRGLPVRGIEVFISFTSDDTRGHVETVVVGSTRPYELDAERLSHLRENCALDIFDIMLNKPRSERKQLEQAVIVASQWHGRAVNALSRAESFVWHTVALERLLICPNETSTVDAFANRLAWLLGSSGDDRAYKRTNAKRLYDLRSRIVHAGETEVPEESLHTIDDWASGAVITLAEKTDAWSSQDEFTKWVESQMMGGES